MLELYILYAFAYEQFFCIAFDIVLFYSCYVLQRKVLKMEIAKVWE